ncbi:MAG TPA: hypothetical protein VJX67_24170 [Blastocatellia bacterium]|nr:hypothetical protein [Blastocatellia bacterium]
MKHDRTFEPLAYDVEDLQQALGGRISLAAVKTWIARHGLPGTQAEIRSLRSTETT